jgi:hypothetical protein
LGREEGLTVLLVIPPNLRLIIPLGFLPVAHQPELLPRALLRDWHAAQEQEEGHGEEGGEDGAVLGDAGAMGERVGGRGVSGR